MAVLCRYDKMSSCKNDDIQMYKQVLLVRRFRLSNVDRKFQVVHLLALMHFSIIMDIVQRYLMSNIFLLSTHAISLLLL